MHIDDYSKFIARLKVTYCSKSEKFRFESLTNHKTKSANETMLFLKREHSLPLIEVIKVMHFVMANYRKPLEIVSRKTVAQSNKTE